MMPAPVFGVDIECPKCDQVHPANSECRELDDHAWTRKARVWLDAQPMGSEITADDCTRRIGRPYNVRLVGAVFNEWRAAGLIVEVRITTTRRRARHHGTLRVWRVN